MPDLMQDRDVNQPQDIVAPTVPPEHTHAEEVSREVIGGGAGAEAICGFGAIVLAIVGLAGILPTYLGGVAAIVVGAGLLLAGAAIGTRLARLMGEMAGSRLSMSDLGGGMTGEFLAGAAGIVLGILALLNIAPMALLSVTAIVFGAALILGGCASASVNGLVVEHHYRGHVVARRAAAAMLSGATGAPVLQTHCWLDEDGFLAASPDLETLALLELGEGSRRIFLTRTSTLPER